MSNVRPDIPSSRVICFAEGIRAICTSEHIVLINKDTNDWIGIPIGLRNELLRCFAGTFGWIEKNWTNQDVTALEFIDHMDAAGMLTSSRHRIQHQTNQDSLVVAIQLTGECNCACTYCYNSSHIRHRVMSRETLRASILWGIEQVDTGHTVHFHFHGGEPLIEWDNFVWGVKYIRAQALNRGISAKITVATNGMFLTSARVQFIKDFSIGVRLSFDGLPQAHDSLRRTSQGDGTASFALHAIELLANYDGLCILTTITKATSHRMLEILAFLISVGVLAVEFRPCVMLGHASMNRTLQAHGRQYADGLCSIIEMISSGGIREIRVETIMRMLVPLLTKDRIGSSLPENRCEAGDGSYFVDTEGGIRGCDMIPENVEKPIGDIWKGIREEDINKLEENLRCKSRQCGRCAWFGICHGGCPGAAYGNNAALSNRDLANCVTIQRVYPYIMDELMRRNSILVDYFRQHYKRHSVPLANETPNEALHRTAAPLALRNGR